MKDITCAVERYRKEILDCERYVWQNPETGYKEFKTSKYLAEAFERLGYNLNYADGITGFYTVIDTGREGPEVLILGELDSIICPEHPECDKETGAVHSCGHNAQCAALLGVAAALTDEAVLAKLSGKIRLCAVPAEELLEIEFRQSLKKEGKIKYMGGKSEFLSRGYFDGVDIAFMVHTASTFSTNKGSVGCIAKSITYKGKAAHAGGSPWNGNNALYAANCGINAINAIRETFRDSDIIRVHPIITSGGVMVNAIPGEARLESYVRGKTYEAITEANARVNRALIGAALSLGTNVEIKDIPGYAPLVCDEGMIDIADRAIKAIMPGVEFKINDGYSSGSTDMGDLSTFMPVIHPYAGGAVGTAHGSDYYIADPEAACVTSAKWQVAMLTLLLENGGAEAKRIIANYKPTFASAKEFLDYQNALASEGARIEYSDGKAVVTL